jgi:hypothetical protein
MPFTRTKATEIIGKALADPRTFGFTLLTIFLDLHGHEGLEYTPATIQMELEQEFGIDMPAGNYDRLLTAINIYTTNGFFVSTPDFVRACVVLSGHHPTPNLMQLPDSEDLAWGITEGLLIHPPEGEKGPFMPEITAFIGEVLSSEGIINPPDVLRIAVRDQSLLSRVNYDYSEDPEMFAGIVQMENSKTDAINRLVSGRLRGLLMQLSTLPLQNGDAMTMATKMLAKMPKNEEPLPLPE